MAAITSMKECCLTAIVEKLIKTAAKATKAFQPLLAFFSFSQQEAMPME